MIKLPRCGEIPRSGCRVQELWSTAPARCESCWGLLFTAFGMSRFSRAGFIDLS